jgi:putative transposase
MRKSRYAEEQIVGILQESEAGLATAELCRKHGISEQTFYRWKARYGGLESNETRKDTFGWAREGGGCDCT